MVLLLWPRFSKFPSRNHTPGTISLISPGLASVRVVKKAAAANETNKVTINKRGFRNTSPPASKVYTHSESSVTTNPMDNFKGESIQAIGNSVGLDVDELISLGMRVSRLEQGAVVLAKVGQIAGMDGSSPEVGSQEIDGGVDIVGESAEGGAGWNGLAAEEVGLKGHHGVNQAVRVRKQHIQAGEPLFGEARFGTEPGDGGFEVRARHAAGLADPVEPGEK